MVQGHLSLVHDLKKNTEGEGLKPQPVLKHEIRAKHIKGKYLKRERFMYCAPRENHGICLTENSV